MLTIRLQRVGRKNDPSFRVVVTESKHKPQTGKYLEMVGSYDARSDKVDIKKDRIKHWIGMGATTSETVHNILINEKVIEGKKINVLPLKSPPKKEEAVAESPVVPVVAEDKAEESTKEEPAAETSDTTVSNDVAVDSSTQ